MYEFTRSLQRKLDSARSAQSEISDAIAVLEENSSDLDNFVSDLEDILSSIENLTIVSLDVDVAVSYDSEYEYDA